MLESLVDLQHLALHYAGRFSEVISHSDDMLCEYPWDPGKDGQVLASGDTGAP